MDTSSALKIAERFRIALEQTGVSVSQMLLFGSFATGTYTENSDIDIIVVSSAFEGLNHWERIEK